MNEHAITNLCIAADTDLTIGFGSDFSSGSFGSLKRPAEFNNMQPEISSFSLSSEQAYMAAYPPKLFPAMATELPFSFPFNICCVNSII